MEPDTAFEQFTSRFPAYLETQALDALRETDFARLDESGHVYLDHTGGGLYAESHLTAHLDVLRRGVFGNPHSNNPASLAATALVDDARSAVLDFFSADPDEYDVVFTPNASGALKLVGEAFPFSNWSCYLVSYDNHNSVNGIREFARRAGADIVYVPVREPDLRLDAELVERGLARCPEDTQSLFAYPAQSNFSGVQHPLEWIERAHAYGWRVLLDSAAFVPTNRLDLSTVKPDFVPVSFYKMFGYPTGIGALIARREALAELQRPWFAGGTITLASVSDGGRHHLQDGHAGFEDGTVDYLGLPAVTMGLRRLQAIGMDVVHARVVALAGWLLERMAAMRHSNGAPLVRIFGPADTTARGGTIAFDLLDPHGAVFDLYAIERLAGEQRISVRTGCFCNPGDGEVAHSITAEEVASCFDEDRVPTTLVDCQRYLAAVTGKVPNTIRVSLGLSSNFEDVRRFAEFAERLTDVSATELPDATAGTGA